MQRSFELIISQTPQAGIGGADDRLKSCLCFARNNKKGNYGMAHIISYQLMSLVLNVIL